ncbi:uncharacterized protein LOC144224633 [Crocuta crocuta]
MSTSDENNLENVGTPFEKNCSVTAGSRVPILSSTFSWRTATPLHWATLQQQQKCEEKTKEDTAALPDHLHGSHVGSAKDASCKQQEWTLRGLSRKQIMETALGSQQNRW